MREEFDELDLLAYADGRLSDERAVQIEAYLADRPELAQRVHDFARQDRELHAQFDRHAAEPLPERLAALFDEASTEPKSWHRRPAVRQAVAAALLMAVTGGAGWWIGQSDDNAMDDTRAFVSAAMDRYIHAPPPAEVEVAGAQQLAAGGPTLKRFSDRISLQLKTPDLGALGYRLVDKQHMDLNGEQGVVLRYTGAGGDQVQVFLKSRWRKQRQDFHTARRGEVTLTYWNDGPLAVAVASARADDKTAVALARKVQGALGRRSGDTLQQTIPKLKPYAMPTGTTQEVSTSADNSSGSTPDLQDIRQ